MVAKRKPVLTRALKRRLWRAAAEDLDGQAADHRKEALKVHDDHDYRQMLRSDARRLEAVARNIRLKRIDRIRALVRDTDTAVRELMPAIVVNVCGWHTVAETCYCPDCAVWPD